MFTTAPYCVQDVKLDSSTKQRELPKGLLEETKVVQEMKEDYNPPKSSEHRPTIAMIKFLSCSKQ
jgi:hypothetical protein